MKVRLRVIISLIFLVATSLATAPETLAHVPSDGTIHATFGPLLYRTHQRRHDFETYPKPGWAATVEGDLDQHGGLELSIQYIEKTYGLRQDDKTIVENATRMYIVTGYRHWFEDWISGGIGFFSSYSMGDPERRRNDFAPGPAPSTSAEDATDYGFDFSVQYEPIVSGRYSVVIDARYSLSVTPKEGEDSNHFGAIVGLKYFVQGRDDPGASPDSRF